MFTEPGEISVAAFVEHVKLLHESNNELFLREFGASLFLQTLCFVETNVFFVIFTVVSHTNDPFS